MTTKPTRWLARKFGRRGAVQVIIGLAFVLMGIDYALHDETHYILHIDVGPVFHGLLWAVPGLIALVAALTHRQSNHMGIGFSALTVPLIVTIFDLFVSGASAALGYGTQHGGMLGALPWLALLALILTIAGWPEICPPRKVRHPPRGDDHAD